MKFAQEADRDALAYCMDGVRTSCEEKARLEKLVEAEAQKPRWKGRVDELRRLKDVDIATVADLVFEAGEFSHFKNARSFAARIGLTPSERSSAEGATHVARSSIDEMTSRRNGSSSDEKHHGRLLNCKDERRKDTPRSPREG